MIATPVPAATARLIASKLLPTASGSSTIQTSLRQLALNHRLRRRSRFLAPQAACCISSFADTLRFFANGDSRRSNSHQRRSHINTLIRWHPRWQHFAESQFDVPIHQPPLQHRRILHLPPERHFRKLFAKSHQQFRQEINRERSRLAPITNFPRRNPCKSAIACSASSASAKICHLYVAKTSPALKLPRTPLVSQPAIARPPRGSSSLIAETAG